MNGSKRTQTLPFGSVFGFTMLVSLTASAAPAIVNKFEAPAREAPSADAALVRVFSEQTKLFVSEEVSDGWRRVRLPEGKTAFIRDEDVRLAAPTSEPIQPLPRRARGPRSASADEITYVKDLDHLAELVKDDLMVQPKASALARRQFAGNAMILGGGLAATLGTLAGMTVLAGQTCDEGYSCLKDFNKPVIYSSLALGMIAATVGWVILPNRADLLEVLNEWNRRHVDTPFTLDREPGAAH